MPEICDVCEQVRDTTAPCGMCNNQVCAQCRNVCIICEHFYCQNQCGTIMACEVCQRQIDELVVARGALIPAVQSRRLNEDVVLRIESFMGTYSQRSDFSEEIRRLLRMMHLGYSLMQAAVRLANEARRAAVRAQRSARYLAGRIAFEEFSELRRNSSREDK